MEDAKQHCLLGGSSAERWIHCNPSARLSEGIEEKASAYAEEGTIAHVMAERKLKRALGQEAENPDAEIVNREMEECTDGYVSFVMEEIQRAREENGGEEPIGMVEHCVEYGDWVKDGFGTCDALIAAKGRLEIVDLKYGMGVKVDATDNSQLKIYALGAISELDCLYDFDKVVLAIYQPRIGNVSTWETSKSDLLKWAEDVLRPAADRAYRGEGEFHAGPWCRFCRAKAVCRERCRAMREMLEKEFRDPALLSDAEVEDVLLKADDVEKYLEDVRDYAFSKAMAGKRWEHFKLVEGRSTRKFTDEGKVAEVLRENSVDPYDTKLRSITDIERELGKARFKELLGSLVGKPQGKPALAPRSDKRPEYSPAKADFEEISKE